MEEFRDLTPTKETRKEVECCDGFAGGSVFGWLVVGSYRETILYLYGEILYLYSEITMQLPMYYNATFFFNIVK